MSLVDEAKAESKPSAGVSTIDTLLVHPDLTDVDRDEITEMLKAPVVGHSAAARVLMRHFGDKVDRTINDQQVRRWRSVPANMIVTDK